MPDRRWLILTQYYPPEIGAPQIRLRSVARELQRHGIEVEVLTAVPNYPTGRVFPGYAGHWKIKETIEGVLVTRTWVYAGTGKSVRVRLASYLSFTLTAADYSIDRAPSRLDVRGIAASFTRFGRCFNEMVTQSSLHL